MKLAYVFGLFVFTTTALGADRKIMIEVQSTKVEGPNLDLIYRATNESRSALNIAEVKCVLFDGDNKVITTSTSFPQNLDPGESDFVQDTIDLKGRTISFDRAQCRLVEAHYK